MVLSEAFPDDITASIFLGNGACTLGGTSFVVVPPFGNLPDVS